MTLVLGFGLYFLVFAAGAFVGLCGGAYLAREDLRAADAAVTRSGEPATAVLGALGDTSGLEPSVPVTPAASRAEGR